MIAAGIATSAGLKSLVQKFTSLSMFIMGRDLMLASQPTSTYNATPAKEPQVPGALGR
jgi:hypothetical protein